MSGLNTIKLAKTLGLSAAICTALNAAPAAAQPHLQPWQTILLDGFDPSSRPADQWRVVVSPYTYHFSKSDEHDYVWLLGLERERYTGSLAGAAIFSNSFGQISLYWYPWGGSYHDLFGVRGLFAKWSAGLLWGYRGEYEDKVPFNYRGLSPAIIPGVGYEWNRRHQVQLNMLGTAGLMLTFSFQVN